MSDPLMTAFDEAVQALEAGAQLEAILARYPEHAAELRPMLLAVRAATPQTPVRVPRQSEAASLKKLLGRASVLRQAGRRGLRWSWSLALRLGVLALAVALGGAGTISVSAASLPGDALYGVKRAVEAAQLALAPDPRARAALEQQFEARRLVEARAVVAAGRVAAISFTGVIEAQRPEWWQIAGLRVVVAPAAVVGVMPAVGQPVRVTGDARADGLIVASRVEAAADAPQTPAPVAATSTDGPIDLTPTPAIVNTAVLPEDTEAAPGSATPAATTPSTSSPLATPRAPTSTPGGASTATPPVSASPTAGAPTHTPSLPAPTATVPPSATPQPAVAPTGTPDDDETETPEPEEVEFSGTLEATGAVWVISGQRVAVTAETEIRDDPQIGNRVKVRAYRLNDGSLVGRRIEKDD